MNAREHKLDDRVAVIMAGGSGTRFWPLSTAQRPKQFLKLFGDRTMLQHTFDRLQGIVEPERVFILTGEQYLPLVYQQLPEVPRENVIAEPMARDTAAAIALAVAVCRARLGDPTMIVLPADHFVEPAEAFRRAVDVAVRSAAAEEALYTFGVPPTYPATGYGYLEAGERLGADGTEQTAGTAPTANGALRPGADDAPAVERYVVVRFKEKPSLQVAKEYVASGKYFWNSGMFVWKTSVIAREIERYLPEHARLIFPLGEAWGTPEWHRRLRDAYRGVPKISIDFGVMERAERVRMVRAPFKWSDVGGWPALSPFLRRDGATNAVRGRLYCLGARDNIVYCTDEQELVALVGVEDMIVVRAGKHTLVAHKDRAEEIKKLVEMINERSEAVQQGRWVADAGGNNTAAVL